VSKSIQPTKQPSDSSDIVLETSPKQSSSQIGCLLRVTWMLVGNIALFAAVASISRQPAWTFSILDVIYFGIVVAVIAARFADITWFDGTTVKNEPVTRSTFIRYSAVLVSLACLLWLAAHAI